MSLLTTTISETWAGNNSATYYDCSYKILADTDITVTKVVSGTRTVLALNVDYTVSGIAAPSGFRVTRVAGALPTGTSWIVARTLPYTQTLDLRNYGGYFGEVHEEALDRLVMMIQQLAANLSSVSSTLTQYSTASPPPAASTMPRMMISFKDPNVAEQIQYSAQNSDGTYSWVTVGVGGY
jgi:hypothetical protein